MSTGTGTGTGTGRWLKPVLGGGVVKDVPLEPLWFLAWSTRGIVLLI